MGKTRDLFKKMRDNKGTFHAKMGSIKNRNVMDQTEAKDVKKRWREYTESKVAHSCLTLYHTMTVTYCASPSMGFSKQEY